MNNMWLSVDEGHVLNRGLTLLPLPVWR
jgi:hypothetical protein